MRRTIARRLVEAKTTVPHFYLTRDASGETLVALHAQLKQSGLQVSLNDLLIKALAIALVRHPTANASFTEEGIVRHGRIDIGIAVAIEEGLVTPVLRGAAEKPLRTIAAETRDLIARARARKLKADEFTGSTFSLSNLGMFGIREFAAIINPPESGILAVGAMEKRPIVVTDATGHDAIFVRPMMTLTLSCDHRVLDGALGAQLLGEIVGILEQPAVLML